VELEVREELEAQLVQEVQEAQLVQEVREVQLVQEVREVREVREELEAQLVQEVREVQLEQHLQVAAAAVVAVLKLVGTAHILKDIHIIQEVQDLVLVEVVEALVLQEDQAVTQVLDIYLFLEMRGLLTLAELKFLLRLMKTADSWDTLPEVEMVEI
jgi:hypothetical protein